ncbi:MAG TPA: hypothetical protein PK275_08440 [Chitinophagaceae bacterium]|nr:hypothetical protein [Chitinophagaceae bacterium]
MKKRENEKVQLQLLLACQMLSIANASISKLKPPLSSSNIL